VDVEIDPPVTPLPISRVPPPANMGDAEIDVFARASVEPEGMLMVPEPVSEATDRLTLPLMDKVEPEGMLMVPEPETVAIDNDILFSTTVLPLISREPLPLIDP